MAVLVLIDLIDLLIHITKHDRRWNHFGIRAKQTSDNSLPPLEIDNSFPAHPRSGIPRRREARESRADPRDTREKHRIYFILYILACALPSVSRVSTFAPRGVAGCRIADAPGNAKRYYLYSSEGVKGTHQTKRRPWPVISTKCRTWASRERHRRGGDAHARCNTAPTARAASSVVAKVAAGVVASKGQFSWRRRRSS